MGGGFGGIIMIAVMFVALYFFMIRPQKKQEKQVKDMRDALQVGDEITTIGGLIGKIVSIKDETLVMETSRDGTKIRILRSAVRCVDVPAEESKKDCSYQKARRNLRAFLCADGVILDKFRLMCYH